MRRTALLRTLSVSLVALVVGISGGALAAPAPPPSDHPAVAVAAGNVFVDGTNIVDGNPNKLTFPPGNMSAPQVVVADTGAEHILGYDFNLNGSALYGVNDTTSSLINVNQSTGAETTVGPMTKPAGDTWVDLTIDPTTGAAYASSANDANYSFYSLNLGTGATTLINLVTTTVVPLDMSMNCAGVMYAETAVDDSLYTVNPANGALTLVGPLGFNLVNAQGMDFDNATGVLHAWVHSLDVATATYSSTYSSINPSTGAATAFPGGSPYGEYEGAVKSQCAAPAVAVTSGPNGKTADLRPTFGFTAGGATTVQCSIDKGTPTVVPCAGSSFQPARDLAPGSWTFRVLGTRGTRTGQDTRAFTVVDCATLRANVAKAKKKVKKAKKKLKRAKRTGSQHAIAKAKKKLKKAKKKLKKAKRALAAEPVCGS
jgi:hypothetical protein